MKKSEKKFGRLPLGVVSGRPRHSLRTPRLAELLKPSGREELACPSLRPSASFPRFVTGSGQGGDKYYFTLSRTVPYMFSLFFNRLERKSLCIRNRGPKKAPFKIIAPSNSGSLCVCRQLKFSLPPFAFGGKEFFLSACVCVGVTLSVRPILAQSHKRKC